MYLFEDQKFFLSVLRQTDFIRPDQALPLLRLFDPRKTQGQAEALIRQLRYAGELAFSGQLLCSPEMLKKQPDPEMLEALDIMLALSGRRLLDVSRHPPCKLSFLLQRAHIKAVAQNLRGIPVISLNDVDEIAVAEAELLQTF